MKNKFIVLGVTVLIIGLMLVLLFLPEKGVEKVKEELLGISYNIDGNEAKLSYEGDNPYVAIYVEGYGSVVMELYPEIAPNTVANFISLIKNGFYDGNSFHRLMPGFVLQGGDPDGTGAGGPGYSIEGEFSNNGFENNLSHEKWVVSMARSGNDYNSAGSQFFICLDDATFLDGDYASFGKVVDGFNVLEKIEKNEVVADSQSGKLRNNIKIKKVIVDTRKYDNLELKKVDK